MYASIESSMKLTPAVGLVALFLAIAPGAATAAPAITALKGSGQQTTYASVFPAPLVVWVTDPATERSVTGLRVNFTAGKGIGLSSTFAITDERGLAAVSATGLIPCASSVTAEIEGIPSAKVRFDGLVVNKAILTIVPTDVNAKVGGGIPAITGYTIQGFVNGDTEETAQITGSPVLTTTATDHSLHANYAIKGGVGSLSAPNYTFTAGFGTLAMVGGSETNDLNGRQQLSLSGAANEDPVVVQAALVSRPEARTVPQPAFVAGLRGQSGVFVRDAIWPEPLAHSAISPDSFTGSAMPNTAAVSRRSPEAPVRAAALPKLANASALAQSVSTRSVLQVAVAATSRGYAVPVRAVVLPNQSSSAAHANSFFTSSAIRKAFNPPGTK
jgi:hypothetical protein